jgi:soluble lytic murein transglycosylase-like protein
VGRIGKQPAPIGRVLLGLAAALMAGLAGGAWGAHMAQRQLASPFPAAFFIEGRPEARQANRRACTAIAADGLAHEVRAAAVRHRVPVQLIHAVVHAESRFDPCAVSRAGARGLMQLMPDTAAMLGVHDSFDPRSNVNGGARYLRALMDRFGGDVRLALAAYNAGPEAVAAHGGIPPFPETRAYVARVMCLFEATLAGDLVAPGARASHCAAAR